MSEERIEPVRIEIDAGSYAEIRQHAGRRADQMMRTTGRGGSVTEHIAGRLGEWAGITWLSSNVPENWRVDDISDDLTRDGDLLVTTPAGEIDVEVKTCTQHMWHEHGRAVPRGQMMSTSAWVYLWVVRPEDIRTDHIHLLGWSPTMEMRNNWAPQMFGAGTTGERLPVRDGRPWWSEGSAPATWNPREKHIRVLAPIRPMSELVAWLDAWRPDPGPWSLG